MSCLLHHPHGVSSQAAVVWDDVYGFDYSCIKDIALREPLVDCVELRAVATQPCAVKYIDIRTAKKEDLTFKVPYELKATRNDCELSSSVLSVSAHMMQDVHAFLAWFDIAFSACHKPIQFSTGPHAKVRRGGMITSLSLMKPCSIRTGNRLYSTLPRH